MTKVTLKRVTTTAGRRGFAQVAFAVPCKPDMFNGYKTELEETVMVYGQTADGIVKRCHSEGFSHVAPYNSNVDVYLPRTTISWEE